MNSVNSQIAKLRYAQNRNCMPFANVKGVEKGFGSQKCERLYMNKLRGAEVQYIAREKNWERVRKDRIHSHSNILGWQYMEPKQNLLYIMKDSRRYKIIGL